MSSRCNRSAPCGPSTQDGLERRRGLRRRCGRRAGSLTCAATALNPATAASADLVERQRVYLMTASLPTGRLADLEAMRQEVSVNSCSSRDGSEGGDVFVVDHRYLTPLRAGCLPQPVIEHGEVRVDEADPGIDTVQ